jgi:hypothetical protein
MDRDELKELVREVLLEEEIVKEELEHEKMVDEQRDKYESMKYCAVTAFNEKFGEHSAEKIQELRETYNRLWWGMTQ